MGQTPAVEEIWNDRFPASGSSGLIDQAAGIVTTHNSVYVAGHKSLSSTSRVIVVLKLDFDGNLLDSTQWPPNPTTSVVRTCKGISIRTSPTSSDSTVAVIAAVDNDTVTLAYYDAGSTGDDLDLVGTATFDTGTDEYSQKIPVAVDVSANGVIGTLVAWEKEGSDWQYGMALYDASDMSVKMSAKFLGSSSDDDFPADIVVGESSFYVTGTSVTSGGASRVLTAKFDGTTNPAPLWYNYFTLTSSDCQGGHFARAYNANFAQRIDFLPIVVGSAVTDDEADFLTVEYFEAPETNQVRWYDRFDLGFNEEALTAAGFNLAETIGDVEAGYYVYVSGSTTSDGEGDNILTQLYYRGPSTSTTFARQWFAGATWNNGTADDDDRCVQVIIPTTDDTGPNNDPHSTRCLVAGVSTDDSGNLNFVTLKYDPAPASVNKEPKWAAFEDGPATTFVDIAVGICHFTVGSGASRKLRFFMTGSSDASASVEDIWTVGFRENFEP